MENVHVKGIKEEIALEVVERIFGKKEGMRVVIAPHPIHGKASAMVPYLDLSESLTVSEKTIWAIISRSKRVRKYCSTCIMQVEVGLRPILCVSEEGLLHIITKLQPSRCQNPEVGERLDELQDELIQILRDVLHGYYRRIDQTSLANDKTLCQLINTLNKTTDPECLELLYERIELLSGKKLKRIRQLSLFDRSQP
jgi:hypothetical protein